MTDDLRRTDPPGPQVRTSTRVHGRSRVLRPWRRFQRWARRSRARDIAVTMLIIGAAFLVLAVALLVMASMS